MYVRLGKKINSPERYILPSTFLHHSSRPFAIKEPISQEDLAKRLCPDVGLINALLHARKKKTGFFEVQNR
jgi:hypothetical protein